MSAAFVSRDYSLVGPEAEKAIREGKIKVLEG